MEIIAFPWGAACHAKILAVLRVRLIFRRAPDICSIELLNAMTRQPLA
jgi:hypothetical protein